MFSQFSQVNGAVPTQLSSNPAPDSTAYNSFSLMISSSRYSGNFNKFIHVLADGSLSSGPALWTQNGGWSSWLRKEIYKLPTDHRNSTSIKKTLPLYANLLKNHQIKVPLTSITWLYPWLRFRAHRGHLFSFLNGPLTKCSFSIGSRAHVRLTCWKQVRIVQKPVNVNPGLTRL